MSIYATLWEMKLNVAERCAEDDAEMRVFGTLPDGRYDPVGHPARERWVHVLAQAVPPWIGHLEHAPGGDLCPWLPPPVLDLDGPHRAVVIVDEDHDAMSGQQYTEPLLVLTGAEYEAAPFTDLLGRIQQALAERFPVDLG